MHQIEAFLKQPVPVWMLIVVGGLAGLEFSSLYGVLASIAQELDDLRRRLFPEDNDE